MRTFRMGADNERGMFAGVVRFCKFTLWSICFNHSLVLSQHGLMIEMKTTRIFIIPYQVTYSKGLSDTPSIFFTLNTYLRVFMGQARQSPACIGLDLGSVLCPTAVTGPTF